MLEKVQNSINNWVKKEGSVVIVSVSIGRESNDTGLTAAVTYYYQ